MYWVSGSLCTLYLFACQVSCMRFGSLLLCLCNVFWALINSLWLLLFLSRQHFLNSRYIKVYRIISSVCLVVLLLFLLLWLLFIAHSEKVNIHQVFSKNLQSFSGCKQCNPGAGLRHRCQRTSFIKRMTLSIVVIYIMWLIFSVRNWWFVCWNELSPFGRD